MNVYLIAAVAGDVIGYKDALPWQDREYRREDQRRFKQLTTGHAVLMGRKTYDSLGKPLSGRHNVVLTTRPEPRLPDVAFCGSLDDGLQEARRFSEEHNKDKVWVIGGQQLFEQTIGQATGLEITKIHERFVGDAFFPQIDPAVWGKPRREDRESISFLSYRRHGASR